MPTRRAKKNAAFHVEQQAEVVRLLQTLPRQSSVDFEAWEQALCEAVLAAGARLLEKLLVPLGCGRPPSPVLNSYGQPMRSIGQRQKTLQTLLGAVRWRRSVFVDSLGQQTRCPGDELLGVVGTGFSPGLRRHMTRAGSATAFAEAAEDLRIYAHVQVDPKDIQRVAESTGRQIEDWMNQQAQVALRPLPPAVASAKTIPVLYVSFDGTGVPIRRVEWRGRRGKQSDGTARTREVKLGCVFTQTRTDDDGYAVRDPDSTTYVGAIESAEMFGWRIHAEAVRRGLEHAQIVIGLTDGAAYNKTIVQTHFPHATHIIDLYHAREHLYRLDELLAASPPQQARWLSLLDRGRVEQLIAQAQTQLRGKPKILRPAVETELHYFEQNKSAMRYEFFRKQGWFVGSGVIEAGCRTLIGQRLKRSGMFWSVRGANAIIASRCCQSSRRFEDFWAENAA